MKKQLGSDVRKELLEAVIDFRHLLSRGYNRESALSFVGDKYQLSREERLTLYRGVYDPKTAKKHQKKLRSLDAIKGRRLAIDGYNTLITLESFLSNKPLISCDDGFIRDVSAVHGKHKLTKETEKALNLLLKFLKRYQPAEVQIFYDAQVGRSGELAALTRKIMKKIGLRGNAQAVKHADLSAAKYGELIASSDAAIIGKARNVIDVAGEIVKGEGS